MLVARRLTGSDWQKGIVTDDPEHLVQEGIIRSFNKGSETAFHLRVFHIGNLDRTRPHGFFPVGFGSHQFRASFAIDTDHMLSSLLDLLRPYTLP
jgi:hypothetical protein